MHTRFLKSSFKSSDLFLSYAPMHLSAAGHEILFEIIQKDITDVN